MCALLIDYNSVLGFPLLTWEFWLMGTTSCWQNILIKLSLVSGEELDLCSCHWSNNLGLKRLYMELRPQSSLLVFSLGLFYLFDPAEAAPTMSKLLYNYYFLTSDSVVFQWSTRWSRLTVLCGLIYWETKSSGTFAVHPTQESSNIVSRMLLQCESRST